jgi:hypothetical protein
VIEKETVVKKRVFFYARRGNYNRTILQTPTNTAVKLVVDVSPERSSGLGSDVVDIRGHVPSMVVAGCL